VDPGKTHFHLFALLAAREKYLDKHPQRQFSHVDRVKGGDSGVIYDELSSGNQTQRTSMIDGKAPQGSIALILPYSKSTIHLIDLLVLILDESTAMNVRKDEW
jgi:hypothetical protein